MTLTPSLPQAFEDAEEPADVRLGQAGGRLVEDEKLDVADQRAGDGDDRFLGAAKFGDRPVEGQRRIEEVEGLRRRGLDRRPVDEPPAHGIAVAHRHVFADAHRLDQAEILVDEGDALAERRLPAARRRA